MAEDTQAVPRPHRVDDHAGAAANPEEHLMGAHNLSIRVQGKEGSWGHAVWALVREERGKVKTLAVFEGTRRAATRHFYDYIHPNKEITPSVPARRPVGPPRRGPSTGQPQRRPQRGR